MGQGKWRSGRARLVQAAQVVYVGQSGRQQAHRTVCTAAMLTSAYLRGPLWTAGPWQCCSSPGWRVHPEARTQGNSSTRPLCVCAASQQNRLTTYEWALSPLGHMHCEGLTLTAWSIAGIP